LKGQVENEIAAAWWGGKLILVLHLLCRTHFTVKSIKK